MSATISRQANRWYVSIAVETVDNSHLPLAENQGAVGVDLGVGDLAVLSTGQKTANPKALTTRLRQLKRLSQSLSRKVKGSANRFKAKQKLAKLHAKISHIRQDTLHKLTTDLSRRFHTIGIEDLNVKGMLKNGCLSRAVSDVGFFEFKRQLLYKSEMRGGQVIIADRWFASSKLCPCCGYKHEDLSLSTREWQCPVCHSPHDRDINAAINLRNYAVSSTVSACGEESAGCVGNNTVKLASVKQEINAKDTYR